MPRAVEFDPAVLGLGKHDDQFCTDRHLFAVEAGELRFFRKANELTGRATVGIQEGVHPLSFDCWQCRGHRLGFLALGWDTLLVFARRRRDRFSIRMRSFVAPGKTRSTSASHRNASGESLTPSGRTSGKSDCLIRALPVLFPCQVSLKILRQRLRVEAPRQPNARGPNVGQDGELAVRLLEQGPAIDVRLLGVGHARSRVLFQPQGRILAGNRPPEAGAIACCLTRVVTGVVTNARRRARRA